MVLVGWVAASPAAGTDRAEEAEKADRPRIGLVLSGGGARGIAHLGVVKVLEELRVPVDFVTGTSMGAVVGGLYASGLSTAELEELLRTIDWNDILDDRPDRKKLPYRRKVDDLTLQTRIELGFSDGKLRFPSGLVPGHKLGVVLRSLTLHTAGVEDFDEFAIPFRAVATDISNGEMVVLGRGDLADAIRASMAVPGAFAPVVLDGRPLVDGGLVRNLPVDVAREMGADIIIAVDVGVPLEATHRLPTMTGVIAQMMDLMTRSNVEPFLPTVDVVIRPELEPFRSSSFVRGLEIAARGEEAARRQAAELEAFAISEEEYARHRSSQRRRESEILITSMQVASTADTDPRRIMRQIRTRPDTMLDLETVRSDLTRLYELGEYETVDFRLYPDGEGYGLMIDARRKSWGPNYLRFGLNLISDFEGAGEFNVLASYTMTHLNRLEAEWKSVVQVGASPLASTEFYQPLGHTGRFFATAGVAGQQIEAGVFGTESTEAEYDVRILRAVAGVGLSLGRYGEIRLGITHGVGRGEPRVGSQEWETIDVEQGGYALNVVIDQFDHVNFPKSGVLGALDLLAARESLGSDDEYDRLSGIVWTAKSFGRHTLLSRLEIGSALGSELPDYDRLGLGGLFRLSGLAPGEISGHYGGAATLAYLYRLGRLPIIGEGFYLGASLEAGNLWETTAAVTADELRWAGSLMLAADTVIGPVYFAHGFAEGGRDALYLLVGRSF